MSGYIGNIPTPQATQTRDVFTATSGQTSFATSGYTPGFLDVYLNGVHLVNGTDYTASNGSDVVLTSGAALNDNLEVVSYSTFEVFGQTFTGNSTFTGDVLIADKIVHDGDTNTAIRFPAADTVTVETAGSERVRVDASGNVGIGTTSPSDKLTISSGTNQIGLDTGDQASFGTLDVGHFSNGAFIGTVAGSNAASNVLRLGTSGVERMRIDASGNVGIGTGSPRGGVDLANNTLVGVGNISGNANSGAYTISAGLDFTNGGYLQLWGGSSANPNIIVFGTSFAERMRIDAAGRITAPNQARCVVTQNGGWRTLTAGTSYGVSDGGFPANNGGFYNGGQINGFNVVHVPVSGWYRFDMYTYSGNGTPAGARLLLLKNDAEEITFVQVPSTTDCTTFMSRMFYMTANDYVNYRVAPPGFPNFTAFFANNHTMLAISLEG